MKIPPHLHTEANIQAEFYHHCKCVELNCALEVLTPIGRFDCAVFSKDWTLLLAIVECKKHAKESRPETGQIRRYSTANVPVHILDSFDACEQLAIKLKLESVKGVLFSEIMARPKRERRARRSRGSDGQLRHKLNLMHLESEVNYRE